MGTISNNLADIRERIEKAARAAGRKFEDIKLVAVSKTKPAALIRQAFDSGQRVFGENYAQEMAAKAKDLSDLPIEWHFVGHLQKNKAKLIVPIAGYIETIDSIELAEVINRRATKKIPCLIEVNVAGELSKSGIATEGVKRLVEGLAGFANIELAGLMTIPPFDPDPEKNRPYFVRLKKLLDELNLKELSMGMSHDFSVAIEEGATIVRIGTAIFGER